MLRPALALVAAGIFPLVMLAPCFAQGAPASAQSSGQSAPSTENKESPAPTVAPKPKKVWTNDDMSDLRANSTVSVVGTRKKNTNPTNYRAPAGQSEYMLKMYRQQIDQLQAQVDNIDKQIESLRDAMSGKTVDSTRNYDPWGGKQGDWNSQIDQLQKNRDSVLKQIDTVEAQIRKLNP
jgi:TolA-binding protein